MFYLLLYYIRLLSKKSSKQEKRDGRWELHGHFAPSRSTVGEIGGAKNALKRAHFDDTEYTDESIPVI